MRRKAAMNNSHSAIEELVAEFTYHTDGTAQRKFSYSIARLLRKL